MGPDRDLFSDRNQPAVPAYVPTEMGRRSVLTTSPADLLGLKTDPRVAQIRGTLDGLDYGGQWQSVPLDFRRLLETTKSGGILPPGLVLDDRTKVRIYKTYMSLPEGRRLATAKIAANLRRLRDIIHYVGPSRDELKLDEAAVIFTAIKELVIRGNTRFSTDYATYLDTVAFQDEIRKLEEANASLAGDVKFISEKVDDYSKKIQTKYQRINELTKDQRSWANPLGADHGTEVARLWAEIQGLEKRRELYVTNLTELTTYLSDNRKKIHLNWYKILMNRGVSQQRIDEFLVEIDMFDLTPDELKDKVKAARKRLYESAPEGSVEKALYGGNYDEALKRAVAAYNDKVRKIETAADDAGEGRAMAFETWTPANFDDVNESYMYPVFRFDPTANGFTPMYDGDPRSLTNWYFVKKEGGSYIIQTRDDDGNVLTEEVIQAQVMSTAPEEMKGVRRDLERAVAQNPYIRELQKSGQELLMLFHPLQTMMRGTGDANKPEEFVDIVKTQAKEIKDYLSPAKKKELLTTIANAKESLRTLKELLPLEWDKSEFEKQIRDMTMRLDQLARFLESDSVTEFCDKILSPSFRADNFSTWWETKGIVMLGGVIGGVVFMTGVALALPSGGSSLAASGWGGLAVLAAAGAIGGLAGAEMATDFADWMYDTGIKSSYQQFRHDEITAAELAKRYGTQFAYSFAVSFAAMGFGRVLAQRAPAMMASQDPLKRFAGQLVYKLGGSIDEGFDRLIKSNSPISYFLKETASEYVQEIAEDVAGGIHPAFGGLVTLMNCTRVSSAAGLTVTKGKKIPDGVAIHFEYTQGRREVLMADLKNEKHENLIEEPKIEAKPDGTVVMTIEQDLNGRRHVTKKIYRPSTIPLELRQATEGWALDEAGLTYDSKKGLFTTQEEDAERMADRLQGMGFFTETFPEHRPPFVAATILTPKGPVELLVEMSGARESVESFDPPSPVVADFTLPEPANNNLNFNPLLQNPHVKSRLRSLAQNEPKMEFEIYFDPAGRDYKFVTGEPGRADMNTTVLSMDEEGRVTNEATSSEAGRFDESWVYMGHAHPAAPGFTVDPSIADIVRFFQESVNEYYILRQDQDTGEITWSRLYRDETGHVRVQYSDPKLNTAEARERFKENLAAAVSQYQPGGPLRAVAADTPQKTGRADETGRTGGAPGKAMGPIEEPVFTNHPVSKYRDFLKKLAQSGLSRDAMEAALARRMQKIQSFLGDENIPVSVRVAVLAFVQDAYKEALDQAVKDGNGVLQSVLKETKIVEPSLNHKVTFDQLVTHLGDTLGVYDRKREVPGRIRMDAGAVTAQGVLPVTKETTQARIRKAMAEPVEGKRTNPRKSQPSVQSSPALRYAIDYYFGNPETDAEQAQTVVRTLDEMSRKMASLDEEGDLVKEIINAGDREAFYVKHKKVSPAATQFFGAGGVRQQAAFKAGVEKLGLRFPGANEYWICGGSWTLRFDGIDGEHVWIIDQDPSKEPLIVDVQNQGRFYVNIRATHALAYLKALTEISEEAKAAGIPFAFKVPKDLNEYGRVDSGVIYFEAADQEWVYEKITAMLKDHPNWVREGHPPTAAPIRDRNGDVIPGLSFAMSPRDISSFGELTSEALAKASRDIKEAYEAGKTITMDLVYKTVAARMKKYGIDPNNPAFMLEANGGSGTQVFDFIHRHTSWEPKPEAHLEPGVVTEKSDTFAFDRYLKEIKGIKTLSELADHVKKTMARLPENPGEPIITTREMVDGPIDSREYRQVLDAYQAKLAALKGRRWLPDRADRGLIAAIEADLKEMRAILDYGRRPAREKEIVRGSLLSEETTQARIRKAMAARVEGERTNPPFGVDDVVFAKPGDRIHNLNGEAVFIRTDEIRALETPPSQHDRTIDGVPFGITSDGRHVMQQQGQRSSGAAAVAMLVMDYGGKPNTYCVKNYNLSTADEQVWRLEQAGLVPIVARAGGGRTKLGQQLEDLIKKNGPGILSVDGELGGHVVVIDRFSMTDNEAIIRDPFHGWSITVSADSILDRMPYLELIQILGVDARQEKDGTAFDSYLDEIASLESYDRFYNHLALQLGPGLSRNGLERFGVEQGGKWHLRDERPTELADQKRPITYSEYRAAIGAYRAQARKLHEGGVLEQAWYEDILKGLRTYEAMVHAVAPEGAEIQWLEREPGEPPVPPQIRRQAHAPVPDLAGWDEVPLPTEPIDAVAGARDLREEEGDRTPPRPVRVGKTALPNFTDLKKQIIDSQNAAEMLRILGPVVQDLRNRVAGGQDLPVTDEAGGQYSYEQLSQLERLLTVKLDTLKDHGLLVDSEILSLKTVLSDFSDNLAHLNPAAGEEVTELMVAAVTPSRDERAAFGDEAAVQAERVALRDDLAASVKEVRAVYESAEETLNPDQVGRYTRIIADYENRMQTLKDRGVDVGEYVENLETLKWYVRAAQPHSFSREAQQLHDWMYADYLEVTGHIDGDNPPYTVEEYDALMARFAEYDKFIDAYERSGGQDMSFFRHNLFHMRYLVQTHVEDAPEEVTRPRYDFAAPSKALQSNVLRFSARGSGRGNDYYVINEWILPKGIELADWEVTEKINQQPSGDNNYTD